MEAVPRLPMICCDMKISPGNTEFGSTLKKFIRDHYNEDPESYNKEIKELETLRQNAIKAPMDFTGCSILKRYYSQLHKLQSRFPMTDDGAACVSFIWTDIYSGVAYNITDIEYEEACILYNIGALYSKLGTMDSRCNAEGMKIACTHFQCAAWAFNHLRDTYPQPKGSDMSHDLLTYFVTIMLAQAQECILEKSMFDTKKSSIMPEIAAQVVEFYKCGYFCLAGTVLLSDTGCIFDIIGSKNFMSWIKFIKLKMSYYTSISQFYKGNQAEENKKFGESVAWFQSACEHLDEAIKINESIDREDLKKPLTFTMDVIRGKYNSSKEENELIYHEKVPAKSCLPGLQGKSFVEITPFSITDPDDIFARLVPMEGHETSAPFSAEKLTSMFSEVEERVNTISKNILTLFEDDQFLQNEEWTPHEPFDKCVQASEPDPVSSIRDIKKDFLQEDSFDGYEHFSICKEHLREINLKEADGCLMQRKALESIRYKILEPLLFNNEFQNEKLRVLFQVCKYFPRKKDENFGKFFHDLDTVVSYTLWTLCSVCCIGAFFKTNIEIKPKYSMKVRIHRVINMKEPYPEDISYFDSFLKEHFKELEFNLVKLGLVSVLLFVREITKQHALEEVKGLDTYLDYQAYQVVKIENISSQQVDVAQALQSLQLTSSACNKKDLDCKIPPPQPDWRCSSKFCNLGSVIFDSDSLGVYTATCSMLCSLKYHDQCWKTLYFINKSDKNLLGQKCLTPECEGILCNITLTFAGRIERIRTFQPKVKKVKTQKQKKQKDEQKQNEAKESIAIADKKLPGPHQRKTRSSSAEINVEEDAPYRLIREVIENKVPQKVKPKEKKKQKSISWLEFINLNDEKTA